jgi:hypothetical protein
MIDSTHFELRSCLILRIAIPGFKKGSTHGSAKVRFWMKIVEALVDHINRCNNKQDRSPP